MSRTETSYDLVAHPRASLELEKLPDEQRDRLVEAIDELAQSRAPSERPDVKRLAGRELLRVRIDRYRAVLALDKPELKLLLVGHRDGFYDRLEVAERRRDE